jgi:hypothetical protein
MQSGARRIQATIADLAATAAAAQRIADVAASTWREIHAVLSPVIGPGGVAALYQRALYVTRASYPGLAAVHEDTLHLGEFAALQLMLAQQTSAEVAATNGALLEAFCDLLTNLIGVSLTERLLRSVRTVSGGDDAVPDSSISST